MPDEDVYCLVYSFETGSLNQSYLIYTTRAIYMTVDFNLTAKPDLEMDLKTDLKRYKDLRIFDKVFSKQ